MEMVPDLTNYSTRAVIAVAVVLLGIVGFITFLIWLGTVADRDHKKALKKLLDQIPGAEQ